MEIPILFENEDIRVVNKPAGLLVHPDGKSNERTLTDWLLEIDPALSSVGESLKLPQGEIAKPGIVHRLDKETSGVILTVKSAQAFAYFKEAFKERAVAKTYRAFVYGEVKDEKGEINKPIGRSARDFRMRSAEYGAKGMLRDSVTHYRTLKHKKEASYLELAPKTGRTHQLRAHLKSIGHPIICDKLYAPSKPCLFEFPRVALHAHTLSFILPRGAKLTIEAPLPNDFLLAIDLFEKT